MRETDLVTIGITETLVLRVEIVKMRRAVAPMAENKNGWLNGDVFEKGFEMAFTSSPEAVFNALNGDGQSAKPDGGVDMKAFPQRRPLPKSDAGHQAWASVAKEGVSPVVAHGAFK